MVQPWPWPTLPFSDMFLSSLFTCISYNVSFSQTSFLSVFKPFTFFAFYHFLVHWRARSVLIALVLLSCSGGLFCTDRTDSETFQWCYLSNHSIWRKVGLVFWLPWKVFQHHLISQWAISTSNGSWHETRESCRRILNQRPCALVLIVLSSASFDRFQLFH